MASFFFLYLVLLNRCQFDDKDIAFCGIKQIFLSFCELNF
nr:MAG TPA: hypothetical protein [Caudoviricetes sp.]